MCMWDADHLDHVKYVFTFRSQGGKDNTPWSWESGTEGVELIIKGRSRFRFDGQVHELGVGAQIWHQPGDFTLHHVDREDPYHVAVIMFATRRPATVRPPRLIKWSDPDENQAFAAEALAVYHRGGFDHQHFSRYLYTRLWWQVHLAEIHGHDPLLPAGILAALDLVEHHHLRPLTVNDLAAAAGLSATHFHRLFKQHVGITPLEAVIRRRLQSACAMLAHQPQRSVRSVSSACGFSDAVHFGRMFKARHRCTPMAYRQQHAYAVVM